MNYLGNQSDRWALVTGVSSGFGVEFAKLLAERCMHRRRGSFPPSDNLPLGVRHTRPPKRWRQNLGVKTAAFPGGHTGWLLRPKGFAAKLNAVLGG